MEHKTGNILLDELCLLNANITLLNSKIDKLQATMEKIEVNTKVSVSL